MPSIFTKIINGEIPCHKILENDKFLAFLDVFPLVQGHILVIPKTETDYIFDIPDTDLADMMLFAKKVAKAQRAAVPCKRIGIAVIGLEVPHAHIHLVPMNTANDVNFTQPKLQVSQDELRQMAEKIKAKL
ncbi:MAG: HIT family protein [Bacteroidia bacterium]|jgi:histidine triad (HIT) family protein